MRVISIIVIILIGCEDDQCVPTSFYSAKQMWIDTQCDQLAKGAILDAVGAMNELSENNICQPIVEVAGDVEVDHYPLDPGVEGVVCYSDEPDWYATDYEGDVAAASPVLIRLFLFVEDPLTHEFIQTSMMHELMHWAAARPGVMAIGHLDPETEDGVMLPAGPDYQEYSDDDADLFCESFDCV